MAVFGSIAGCCWEGLMAINFSLTAFALFFDWFFFWLASWVGAACLFFLEFAAPGCFCVKATSQDSRDGWSTS
jgi:hypothetical protein